MKALILAGGRGKRLDDLSSNQNKCMIPIHGRPVIEYNIEHAVNTSVNEIIIVVGYKAEEIINRFGNQYKNKKIKYVIQWEQKGLVDAIDCAKETIQGDDFLLMLGDEMLVNPKHQQMIDKFYQDKVMALCGILWVDNVELIKRTYTLIQDEENIIYRLIEKPRNPMNNYMGTGVCVFQNGILNYIPFTPIHYERKEKELPDLIQCVIDDGKTVKTFIICDKYNNINTIEDISFAESFFNDKGKK
jgi:dTDP-glucose pyrophosphorylase